MPKDYGVNNFYRSSCCRDPEESSGKESGWINTQCNGVGTVSEQSHTDMLYRLLGQSHAEIEVLKMENASLRKRIDDGYNRESYKSPRHESKGVLFSGVEKLQLIFLYVTCHLS